MSDAVQANTQGGQTFSTEEMRERIRAAADHAAQCYEAWKLASKQRDELIVTAYEADKAEGHSRKNSERALANWARLSQSRIHGIIAAA